jgi:hypothetical protein
MGQDFPKKPGSDPLTNIVMPSRAAISCSDPVLHLQNSKPEPSDYSHQVESSRAFSRASHLISASRSISRSFKVALTLILITWAFLSVRDSGFSCSFTSSFSSLNPTPDSELGDECTVDCCMSRFGRPFPKRSNQPSPYFRRMKTWKSRRKCLCHRPNARLRSPAMFV